MKVEGYAICRNVLRDQIGVVKEWLTGTGRWIPRNTAAILYGDWETANAALLELKAHEEDASYAMAVYAMTRDPLPTDSDWGKREDDAA